MEALAVMDAERLALARPVLRRGGRAIRHHRGAESGSDARRIRARDPAGRRDRAGQSHRRRSRAAPRVRAVFCAARAPARLAAGVPLSERLSDWAEQTWRRAGDRATRHAAARAFFIDPFRTSARSGAPQRGLSRATRNLTCRPFVVTLRLDTARRGGAPWTAISAFSELPCSQRRCHCRWWWRHRRRLRPRSRWSPRVTGSIPTACGDNGATVGQGARCRPKSRAERDLSEKLARSGGVICPPPIRRSGDQGADAAGRFDAGHSAAGQPGWRTQYSAEMTRHGNTACLTDFRDPSYIRPIPADIVSEWRGSSAG